MSNKVNSEIVNFLNSARNSRLRETIFKYSLYHDLKLAASKFNENLKIYEPEVDNEGCDIIIEDGRDFSRKIQLKSIYHSKTRQWKIHKSILLPALSQMSDYGLDTIFCPTTPGGVILIDASEKLIEKKKSTHEGEFPQNNYSYLYTDINIIYLIYFGVISSNESSKVNAKNIILKIQDQFYYDKLTIPRNLFVEVKGSIGLIKLLGVCGNYDFINYSHKFIRNSMNRGAFFKTLNDYNVYETSLQELEKKNELLKKDTEVWQIQLNNELLKLIKIKKENATLITD
jgi:hypothetical protein